MTKVELKMATCRIQAPTPTETPPIAKNSFQVVPPFLASTSIYYVVSDKEQHWRLRYAASLSWLRRLKRLTLQVSRNSNDVCPLPMK